MSALMTRRRRSPARDRDHRQPSLFSQLVAPPPVEAPAPVEAPDTVEVPIEAAAAPTYVAPDPVAEPPVEDAELTLEDAIAAIWDDLTANEATDCPVCGETMEPRHSAGAGVVGGRCTGCGTTLA